MGDGAYVLLLGGERAVRAGGGVEARFCPEILTFYLQNFGVCSRELGATRQSHGEEGAAAGLEAGAFGRYEVGGRGLLRPCQQLRAGQAMAPISRSFTSDGASPTQSTYLYPPCLPLCLPKTSGMIPSLPSWPTGEST
jgi:hypothetical protein